MVTDSPLLSLPNPNLGVAKLIRTQLRITIALAVRSMEAEYSRYRVGFAWAFIEPGLYIMMLSIGHLLLRNKGASALHGMTPLMFIILGVLPYRCFSQTVAIHRVPITKHQLLQLPGVTMLDIIVSEALADFCLTNTVFLGFCMPCAIYAMPWPIQNLAKILALFNSAWLLGLGFGLCLIPINRVWSTLDSFLSAFMRVIFWTSGVFFVVESLPAYTWPYVAWNPIMNVTELIRSAWFPVYTSPIGSPYYIVESIVVFFAVGLVSERLLRRLQKSK